jgi:hypothetical protein
MLMHTFGSVLWGMGLESYRQQVAKAWDQLHAGSLGAFSCKPKIFRKRIRKAIINGVKLKE